MSAYEYVSAALVNISKLAAWAVKSRGFGNSGRFFPVCPEVLTTNDIIICARFHDARIPSVYGA